jgi:protein-S-isoprenylcysteine O-methyltransferase Ste14
MTARLWTLIKTLLFTAIGPGTVAVYIPLRLHIGLLATRPSGAVGAVAAGLLAFGLGLYLVCAWTFAVVGLGTPAPIDPPTRLVVHGPYRWTRNPMYVAVLSVLAGEALIARSAALGMYVAAVLLGFNAFVLLFEEPVLRHRFGPAYGEYCARVPRWIPIRPSPSRGPRVREAEVE